MPLDEEKELQPELEPSSEHVVETANATEEPPGEHVEPEDESTTGDSSAGEASSDDELRDELDEEREEEAEEHELEEERAHVGPAKGWLTVSILLTLAIAVWAGISTDSMLIFSVIGFLPTVACIIIFIALLEGNYKDILFWLVPLGINLLFLGIGPFLNNSMMNQLDVPMLTAVNMILSYIILAIMMAIEYWHSRREEDVDLEHVEPEQLDKYIHTIEDRVKAINFVIGRVYRDSHGGSKELREKLRVPSDWYNEFHSIASNDLEDRKDVAIELLGRIRERLEQLLRPEKDVFTRAEVQALKGVAHDGNGYDRIIDVLAVNDRDPVEDYLMGALDFCKKVSEGLNQ